MENAIKLIAEQLTGKNKLIKGKPNSVFEYIDLCQGDDDKIQEVCREISTKLGNEIDLFKNKLLPLLKEIKDLTDKKIEKYSSVPDSANYRVVEYDMPVVVSNLRETGLLQAARVPRTIQEESLFVPTPDKIDLSKYLELDTATTTNGLQVIVGKYSDEDLLNIWETYLSNISSNNLQLNLLLTDPAGNVETLLILFAYLYNLNKEKPANVDADDNKYFGIIKYALDEVGNYISRADELFETGRSNGRLIVTFADDNHTIKVDEKLYQTFVEEGNTPEILFGLASSSYANDSAFRYYDKIVEIREALLTTWNKKIKMEHYSESVKKIETYKAVYSILLPEYYNLVPDDLKEILEVSEEQAVERLQYKLDTEKESEIVDSLYMSREIVGYVLFANTGFHRFTGYMCEIEKLNPEFNANEIANFATVQLLLEYLTDQIIVE